VENECLFGAQLTVTTSQSLSSFPDSNDRRENMIVNSFLIRSVHLGEEIELFNIPGPEFGDLIANFPLVVMIPFGEIVLLKV
jgi:hypothetical protein